MDQDTIVAVATAPGPGGIGVVRMSGDKAGAIGNKITGIDLKPRYAHYCGFTDNNGLVLDSGIGLFFPGPHSFTGEDIVELQGHGGPISLDLIVKLCCSMGARQAQPGEFSLRAYLNNKIDLTQAEAIADLINSSTEQAALNASRSLKGEFSEKIKELVQLVTQLRVLVEAAIDFPEEEIDFIKDTRVAEQLDAIVHQFEAVALKARQGSLVREGMKLVIAGRPNAGKSSLLNTLSGQDNAIVTATEGTTRDVLREHVQIDGMPLHIVDTAGLRNSEDEIEQEGIRRARAEMASADRILLVIDGTRGTNIETEYKALLAESGTELPENIPVTIIKNKIDLSSDQVAEIQEITQEGTPTVVRLSAKTGEGVDLLKQHLKNCMGYKDTQEGNFSARRRHLEALQNARHFLLEGQRQLRESGAGELLAEDLKQCQDHLGEITGAVSSDDLLGEIFSSFCIGK